MSDKGPNESKHLSRREFVTGIGGVGIGAVVGGVVFKGLILPDNVFAVPVSEGYLLVDTMKCSGCATCMLSCALVHSGETSLSLSRIQVVNNPFTPFPAGVTQNQCRQCPYPACVDACPTGANHVDESNGNVRTIDAAKCIGCERCIEACPFDVSRIQWNSEEKHGQKCDLCAETPYWGETGGASGKQACVEMCPMHAITFTKEVPVQNKEGYVVNLRKDSPVWKVFGMADGDNGEFLSTPGAVAGGA